LLGGFSSKSTIASVVSYRTEGKRSGKIAIEDEIEGERAVDNVWG